VLIHYEIETFLTKNKEMDAPTFKDYIFGNIIIIKSNNNLSNSRVYIIDITGRVLGSYNGIENIPVPKTAGVYLVTMENNGQIVTKKIVVR